MHAVNRGFVYIDFDDERFPPCERGPLLAPLGRSWRLHGLQEASKWSPTGAPDRIWGHLGAKRAPKSSTPQRWRSFSGKMCQKHCFFSQNEPLGILKRIQRKRNMRRGTDPGFPTPGARMTVVTQTPSKLYIYAYIVNTYIVDAYWGGLIIC